MSYKEQITSIHVVAVKKGQSEVNAPEHAEWGTVKCDSCGDVFFLAPSRIYAASGTPEYYGKKLESLLAEDHQLDHPHLNSYDLG